MHNLANYWSIQQIQKDIPIKKKLDPKLDVSTIQELT